jgi:hypothetical protein
MQHTVVWLPDSPLQLGSVDAKSPFQPGSGGMSKSGVSVELGSCGAACVHERVHAIEQLCRMSNQSTAYAWNEPGRPEPG